ncbi:hypothetical protein O181_086970 [Austropuccinia psidii MF-1]|uniref:Probable cytosolic iron-sulfur protein assembly protein 1 n=1 Tax=Austropuccinia psidii MF-1 TaxID=1389203 RepID=A0A9Q3INT8_9BASI|nr:hypothetical protein [Austropuccinia psidii MF-1]
MLNEKAEQCSSKALDVNNSMDSNSSNLKLKLIQTLKVSCSTDKEIKFYKFNSNNNNNNKQNQIEFKIFDSIPSSHTRTIRNLNWSPNGEFLASVSFDSTCSIWSKNDIIKNSNSTKFEIDDEIISSSNDENWDCLMSLEGHESEVKSVAWNRNGNLIATCSRDKTVWIWEILIENQSIINHDEVDQEESYEVLAVLMEHDQDVKSVCWSPKEDLLCSTSYDNNIHLYAEDHSDGEFTLIHRLKGHQSTVWNASFSPCGEYLASCSDDLSIRIWHRQKISMGGVEGRDGGLNGGWRIGRSERERWTCVNVISGYHSRTIYSLDWTSTNLNPQSDSDLIEDSLGTILTCGGDGKINIFEIFRGSPVAGLDTSSPQPIVNHLVQKKKAHGVSDINCVSCCKIKKLPTPSDTITSNWRESAQRLIASAGDDGTIKIWMLSNN